MSKEGMSTPRTGIISVILLIAAIASLILAEKSYTSTYYRYVDKRAHSALLTVGSPYPKHTEKRQLR